jgi:hypothetical protein
VSKQTDVLYGRRGGRMAGTGRDPKAPRCEVCAGPMHVGQYKRHATCSPPCEHFEHVDLCRGWKGACNGGPINEENPR